MQGEIDKDITCCFTGHRLIPYGERPYIAERTIEAIRKKIAEGYVNFISGGALGFDIMAAKIVLQQKMVYPHIKLIMALPCKNQSSRWKKTDIEQYDLVLSEADEVIYVSEAYCTGCMHMRNRYMVNNSSVCIAYLTKNAGGTAYTVGYAKECAHEVINVAYMRE